MGNTLIRNSLAVHHSMGEPSAGTSPKNENATKHQVEIVYKKNGSDSTSKYEPCFTLVYWADEKCTVQSLKRERDYYKYEA